MPGCFGSRNSNSKKSDNPDQRLLIDLLRSENKELRAQLNAQSDDLIKTHTMLEAVQGENKRLTKNIVLSQKVIATGIQDGKRYRRKIRSERRQRKELEDAIIAGSGVLRRCARAVPNGDKDTESETDGDNDVSADTSEYEESTDNEVHSVHSVYSVYVGG